MTKISKCFLWMESYLESALPYLPATAKLTRVTAWSKSDGRYGKGCQACIITNDDKSFRVYIKTHRHPRGEEPTPYSKLELLELLAHELAHTVSFENHTPEHKELESKLSILFMRRLRREGYESSEEELNQKAR